MNKLKNQNGITLIALVITIIVMLILVAVTITMAVNGGLFDYARKAGQETNRAIEKEQQLADLEANLTVEELINKYEKADYTLEDLELEIGSEVTFQVREASYTAKYEKTGYSENDNNRCDQTFTTVGEGEIAWHVLRQEGDNIYLIGPQTTTGTTNGEDNGGYLWLEGARGYLYGPNELNEICKAIFSYEDENGKLYEARSINEKDFLKLSEYNPSTYVNQDSNYGKKMVNLITNENNRNYPFNNNGKLEIRNGFPDTLIFDHYEVSVDDLNLTDEEKSMMFERDGFSADHWLASICHEMYDNMVLYKVRVMETSYVVSADLYYSNMDRFSNGNRGAAIRPVISLPSAVVKAIIEAE